MDVLGIEIEKNTWNLTILKASRFGIKARLCMQIAGESEKALINSLIETIGRDSLRNLTISLCLPDEFFISRVLTVPAPSPEALNGIIRFEIEKHIPYGIDETRYTFKIIEKKNNVFSVLVTAARDDAILSIITLFKEHGLEVRDIETRHTALFNILDYWNTTAKESIFSVIHIKHNYAIINTFSGNIPVDSRKIKIEDDNTNNWVDTLERELRSTAAILSTDGKRGLLDKVFLLGIAPVEKEFTARIRNKMSLDLIRVELSDMGIPDTNVISAGMALSTDGRGSLSTNLLSSPAFNEVKKNSFSFTSLLFAVVIFLLFSSGISYLARDIITLRQLERTRIDIGNKTVELRERARSLEALNRRIDFLEQADGMSSTGPLDILKELTTLLPYDTSLMKFELNNGVIHIDGVSNQASSLLIKMAQSNILHDVEFTGPVTKLKAGKERFNIKARLRSGTYKD